MTTIAVNREMMAADRKHTHDDVIFFAKKIWRNERLIVSSAGCCDAGDKFIKWLLQEDDEPENMEEVSGIVLSKRGIEVYANSLTPIILEQDFYAVGSGAQAALGALHMGATPEEAVKIASQICPYTGGIIDVERL